jgi:hypothetical protein
VTLLDGISGQPVCAVLEVNVHFSGAPILLQLYYFCLGRPASGARCSSAFHVSIPPRLPFLGNTFPLAASITQQTIIKRTSDTKLG